MSALNMRMLILFGCVSLLESGCAGPDNQYIFSPASANECNASCESDHTKDQACFENPAVLDYAMNKLIIPKMSELKPFLAREPIGACFCGTGVLSADGSFVSINIRKTTSVEMSDAIVETLLKSDPIPVPPSARCVVGKEFPLSFNNFER